MCDVIQFPIGGGLYSNFGTSTPKTVKCRKCRHHIPTWAECRQGFGRLVGAGIAAPDVKAKMPLCRECADHVAKMHRQSDEGSIVRRSRPDPGQLIEYATEIKLRAERRAGSLLL